jgi:hypothetical protein
MPSKGTRVMLVDCAGPAPLSESSVESIRSAVGSGFELLSTSTGWNGGLPPLDLQGAEIVFISGIYSDVTSGTLHATDSEKLQALLANGGLVIMFVSTQAKPFHIKNLLGFDQSIEGNSEQPTSCRIIRNTPLDPLFTKLGNRIWQAPVLRPLATNFRAILTSAPGLGVALLGEFGKGRCVLLPHFGNYTAEAIGLILKEVLPQLSPHLAYDEALQWLQEPDYLMPSLDRLRTQREDARSEYELLDKTLHQKYEDEWRSVQAGWNELLTSGGDTLKLAVKRALELFGWRCVDVDEYWRTRDATRQKEEDLWLADGFEPDPSKAKVILVEVKSNDRGTASERDYSQLIKYLNRRKSEFKNSDLQGLLVINHSLLTPAKERRRAFSETTIRDAQTDDVRLVTTWDIFRLVQRLSAGTLTEAEVRGLFAVSGEVVVPDAT